MKANSLTELRPLRTAQFWLLAIASGLVAIYLSLSWRSNPDLSQLSMSLLCWGAVFSLLWDKRHTLSLESDMFSSVLGLAIVAFILLRSVLMSSFDIVFVMSPFIAALGVALLASGFKHLRQYWQELFIIFALHLPVGILVDRISILSVYTAKFATLLLSYLGVEYYSQGVNIVLGSGKAVEVAAGCSGWETIFPLLKLSVLFLVMFPTGLVTKILVPVAAFLIAFVVNGVRVTIMAILVGYSQQETFEYWHKGTGSQIFFLTATVLFGTLCYFLSRNKDVEQPRELSGS